MPADDAFAQDVPGVAVPAWGTQARGQNNDG